MFVEFSVANITRINIQNSYSYFSACDLFVQTIEKYETHADQAQMRNMPRSGQLSIIYEKIFPKRRDFNGSRMIIIFYHLLLSV